MTATSSWPSWVVCPSSSSSEHNASKCCHIGLWWSEVTGQGACELFSIFFSHYLIYPILNDKDPVYCYTLCVCVCVWFYRYCSSVDCHQALFQSQHITKLWADMDVNSNTVAHDLKVLIIPSFFSSLSSIQPIRPELVWAEAITKHVDIWSL